VAQQQLHRAYIDAALDQMCGEAISKRKVMNALIRKGQKEKPRLPVDIPPAPCFHDFDGNRLTGAVHSDLTPVHSDLASAHSDLMLRHSDLGRSA
jgi:hypothetical protein